MLPAFEVVLKSPVASTSLGNGGSSSDQPCVYMYMYIYVYVYTHLSIYPSAYLSAHLPTYIPTYLPTYLPTCLRTCLSMYLSTCLCKLPLCRPNNTVPTRYGISAQATHGSVHVIVSRRFPLRLNRPRRPQGSGTLLKSRFGTCFLKGEVEGVCKY